jgi:hypothetical protein
MCQSCNIHIEGLWQHLAIGQRFRTPDRTAGAEFEIAALRDNDLTIVPQNITIPAESFSRTLHFLRLRGHGPGTPCEVGSSNDPEAAGPLCTEARSAMPHQQRCINYVVGIMGHFGLLGIDGARPNRVWTLP